MRGVKLEDLLHHCNLHKFKNDVYFNRVFIFSPTLLGLTLYEVCTYRSTDLQKALISFVVDQDCNNSTIPIGNELQYYSRIGTVFE